MKTFRAINLRAGVRLWAKAHQDGKRRRFYRRENQTNWCDWSRTLKLVSAKHFNRERTIKAKDHWTLPIFLLFFFFLRNKSKVKKERKNKWTINVVRHCSRSILPMNNNMMGNASGRYLIHFSYSFFLLYDSALRGKRTTRKIHIYIYIYLFFYFQPPTQTEKHFVD